MTLAKLGSYDPGMKRSQGQGKLRLSKESLRVLSGSQLAQVRGGTGGDPNPVESTNPNTACDGWIVEVKGPYSQVVAPCTGGSIVLPSKIKAGG